MHSQQPPGVVQNWSTLQCSKQNIEQCGYDHAPVTRGRMRAQFPLPHGPHPPDPNPGGDRDAPNNLNPLFWARERGREKQRERERGLSTVGKDQRGATGEKEQGRARENGREREGERPTERETGANQRKGRWWVRADQGSS